ADAAGIAEMTFGAGKGERGTVLMLTFGTGVGSALFTGGLLVANTEFGHIEIRGKDAERRGGGGGGNDHTTGGGGGWGGGGAEEGGGWGQQGGGLLAPDVMGGGGGMSRGGGRGGPGRRGARPRFVPATLHNDAGIVGAAMAAAGVGTAE